MYSLVSINLYANQSGKEECACCKGRKTSESHKKAEKETRTSKAAQAECSDCIYHACYRTLVIDFLVSLKAKTKAL